VVAELEAPPVVQVHSGHDSRKGAAKRVLENTGLIRFSAGDPELGDGMDRGVKVALASCVLLGGVVVALVFPHQSPSAKPATPGCSDQLVLRQQMGPQTARKAEPPRPQDSSDPPAATQRATTILTPLDGGQPPPALAPDYPRTETAIPSRWGDSVGIRLPEARHADPPVQSHKITDGDTLDLLAERYLGSADRSMEIYEANRDVLPSPDLLPIGTLLRMPPRAKRNRKPAALGPRRPLVPIPPRNSRPARSRTQSRNGVRQCDLPLVGQSRCRSPWA